MKSRLRLLVTLATLTVPALACSLAGGGGRNRAVLPTQVVEVEVSGAEPTRMEERHTTATPATGARATRSEPADTEPRSTPEATALPVATTVSVPELVLADSAYSHPSGAFSLVPPAGWTIEESSGAASFDATDGTGFIYVQITNTGRELEREAFDKFVTYRDLNFFDDFEGYEVLSKEVDAENGAATVVKLLTFKGVAQTVVTFYYQYGAIIYSFDFWSNEDFFDAYDVLYGDVLETADVNPEVALDQAEYFWVYTFTGPGDIFTVDVPTAWQYERTESDDMTVDSFIAPDGHAVVQSIAYDSGRTISRGGAADFALELLHNSYAPDIRILSDQIQPDGSERLIWSSPGGEYNGISLLATRDTTFLLLTTKYDNEYQDIYRDVLEFTISSYSLPAD